MAALSAILVVLSSQSGLLLFASFRHFRRVLPGLIRHDRIDQIVEDMAEICKNTNTALENVKVVHTVQDLS